MNLLYNRRFNLSPSKLEFCLIMYFILYVCPLMVNKNNSYCFKWSSIQLLLDSKSILFHPFLLPSQLQCDWRLLRDLFLQLVSFCSQCKTAVEKRPSWIEAVLYCSGAGCDLRDSNQRNPSSNSQCQTAKGINQHGLGNSAFLHQLKPKYIWGTGSSESQYSSRSVNYSKIAQFDLTSSLN